MQTAVEWLLNQIDLETISKYDKQLVQAKEMEKQQAELIAIAMVNIALNNIANENVSMEKEFEQYYNKTFKK
jgi:hypothetical protein